MAASFSVCPSFARSHRALEHADRLVVDLQRHRERVAVLAAVREREARRIARSGWARRGHLRDRGERLARVRAPTPGTQQQLRESPRAPVSRAAASVAVSRRESMSSARTSWCAGIRSRAAEPAQPRSGRRARARASAPRATAGARGRPGSRCRRRAAPRSRRAARRRSCARSADASGSGAPAARVVHPCWTTTHAPSSATMKPCR